MLFFINKLKQNVNSDEKYVTISVTRWATDISLYINVHMYKTTAKGTSCNVIFRKLGQQIIVSVFDFHWVLYTFDFMLKLN